jgi:hypothetical protein
MTIDRILAVVDEMARVQAANPGAEDLTGFNNADYPAGLVLAAAGDVQGAAALLFLYPRQAEGYGITREDLLPYLPSDFEGRTSARSILGSTREALQGKVAHVVTEDGVIFNGVRMGLDTTAALKRLGAVRTTTGFKVALNRIEAVKSALAGSLINPDGLDAVIAGNTQEIPAKAVAAKASISFTVTGSTVGWTYRKNDPIFDQIKEIVKGIGARYNGAGGWDMKPENIAVLAVSIADLDLPGVDYTALAPFAAKATPETLALRDEIATNSLVIKVKVVTPQTVTLTVRKYDQRFIDACKGANGRYNGEGGWTVPTSEIPAIVTTLAQHPQFELSNLDAYLPSEVEVEAKVKVEVAPVTTPTGLKLFNHQVDDVSFLIKPAIGAKGLSKLLGNDMGTGKTLSAIVAADKLFPQGRFLIVVPAVAKLNWEKEIRRFIGKNETIQVINGRSATLDRNCRWTIINYDIINYYKDALMASKYDIAILDEVHNIKSYNAQRTAALIPTWDRKANEMTPGILSNIPNVWTMTGTFIMNRMKELFTTLRAIDHKLGRSKRKYEERYCDGHDIRVPGGRVVWQATGFSNLEELARTLAPVYRKVMKADVLDLPEKLRTDFTVEVSPAVLAEIHALEAAMEAELENFDEEEGCNVLPFITRLKMTTAQAKIAATLEQAEAVIDAEGKVIIFTEYTEILQTIVKHFGDAAVYIDGSITGTKREAAVERFQTDPSCKVLVGNIKACGVAITLTAANFVIFNDKPWNPALAAQAEDRAYRIGQTRTVNIVYMTAPGTYDEALTEKLLDKSTLVMNWETMTDAEVKALAPRSETAELLAYLRGRKGSATFSDIHKAV